MLGVPVSLAKADGPIELPLGVWQTSIGPKNRVAYIYSSLFVKKNDSIEKIKNNVTKLQKNKLRNLNKYTT